MAKFVAVTDSNGDKFDLGYIDTSNTQKLDGGSSSAASTVFSTEDPMVLLISAPEAFHIEIDETPVATTNSTYLPAGIYQTGIRQGHKVAVIKATGTSAGLVWATPYQGDEF